MIIIYEKIIWYSDVCSNVQEHRIKFWLWSQFLVLIHHALNIKESILVLNRSIEISEVLEDNMKKCQQKVKVLIRRCIKPGRL